MSHKEARKSFYLKPFVTSLVLCAAFVELREFADKL